ncbi:hypothetical protein Taro_047839 [Colocasia esculenta]|uniref:Poly(A) RNA polymerase mitochondrial-like central palm domain-containing protein n=1 Tax=Colocasia esculenta TaxID=4460 RepID=A0A843X704_COLES|nr:hypothetical protein [Colocasia esculenta]
MRAQIVLSRRPPSFNWSSSSSRDILFLIKPREEDRVSRLITIDDVRKVIQSVTSLKGAAVNPFGSFISNLYTKWGDLDLSVQVSHSLHSSIGKRRKQNLLREVMMAFRRAGWGQLQFIPHARVPLLIYENSSRSISCDISIDNYVGLIKSKIFLWITEIDERFRDMVLLIKEWAKVHDINVPKAGTLNSYSLCLLVIFHFQTCNPPILPPLKDIYGGNLFSKIRELATDNAICTYSAKWESIRNKLDWSGKSYKLIVEDPFEQPDNAARAVGETGLTKISNAFAETYRSLSSSLVLSDKKALLSILVRPHVLGHVGSAPRLHEGSTGTRGHENRTVTNYAAAHSPRVQTRVATSGVSVHSQVRSNWSSSSSSPSSTSRNSGVSVHSQVRNNWSSSSPSSTPRSYRGARETQSRTVWTPRYT